MIRRSHLPTLGAFVVMAALGGALLGGTVLAAQGSGPGGRGASIVLRALDLTGAQREQVRQLTEQHREQTRTLAERVRATGEAQREAIQAAPFNEQQFRATALAFAKVRVGLTVKQARLRSDIYALLTTDQQQELARMQTDREARQAQRQERMQRRRQRQQSP